MLPCQFIMAFGITPHTTVADNLLLTVTAVLHLAVFHLRNDQNSTIPFFFCLSVSNMDLHNVLVITKQEIGVKWNLH